MKNIFKLLLIAIFSFVIIFSISGLGITAKAAEEDIASGTVGDGISWVIGADGTLTISGSGEAFDFSWYSPPWIEYADQITSVKIEEGITKIPDSLLCSLDYTSKIYIPSTVSYIGSVAFDNSFGIGEYVVAADNENFKSEDGVLYSKDGRYLIRFPSAHHAEEFAVPESVFYIQNEAFACSRTLKVLSIGENVLTMGSNFLYNTMVEEIIFETAASSIPSCAFSYCRIESFIVPDTVEKLKSSIFFGVDPLKTLVIGSGVKEIGSYLVYGTPNLSIIHYNGTAESWSSVSIDAENEDLFAKEIHYVSYKDGYGATCVDGHEGGLYCEECEAYLTGEIIPSVTDHIPGEPEIYVDPADCENGAHQHNIIYCTVCEIEISHDEYLISEKLGHEWSDGICLTCGEVCDHYDSDYDTDCNICDKKAVFSYKYIQIGAIGSVRCNDGDEADEILVFIPTKSGYYVITSDNGGDNDVDPIVKICDNKGNEIASGDDYGSTFDFRVGFDAEAGRVYVINLDCYTSDEITYKYLLTKEYQIVKQPTSEDTEVKADWDGVSYQWYEYIVGEEITDKNAEAVNTYGQGSGYVQGKGWYGDYWAEGEASFFTIELKSGESVLIDFGRSVKGITGIWDVVLSDGVKAESDNGSGGRFIFTAPFDGSFEIYSYDVAENAYIKAYKITDFVPLEEETSSSLKDPKIGKVYACSVSIGEAQLMSEALFYDYAIIGFPKNDDPTVKVNAGEATYQWSQMIFDEEYTSGNAEIVDWGKGASSYSAEGGWRGVNDRFGNEDCFDYFTVELEADESITIVVFGDAFYVGIYDYEEETGGVIGCVKGNSVYTIMASEAGSYTVYVATNSGEVRLKAYIGEVEYIEIDGATNSSYYAAEDGWYLCDEAFANGKDAIVTSYFSAHQHKDEDSNYICDLCDKDITPDPGTGNSGADEPGEGNQGATDGGENNPDPEKTLAGGQVALIVIGSLAVVGIGVFSVVWFVIKKKSFEDLVSIIKVVAQKNAPKK